MDIGLINKTQKVLADELQKKDRMLRIVIDYMGRDNFNTLMQMHKEAKK